MLSAVIVPFFVFSSSRALDQKNVPLALRTPCTFAAGKVGNTLFNVKKVQKAISCFLTSLPR